MKEPDVNWRERTDRLLEGEELNLLPLAEYTKQLLKAQDAKTAHLVAQEIFKDLNKYRFAEPQYIAEAGREPVIICLTENDMLAIKSKWEGENG